VGLCEEPISYANKEGPHVMKKCLLPVVLVVQTIGLLTVNAMELSVAALDARVVDSLPLPAEDFPRGAPSGAMLTVSPPANTLFLVLHLDINVTWTDQTDEKESWEGTLADISVKDKGGAALPFYGQFTRDGRLLFSKPQYARFQIREEWEPTTCRLDVVYTVSPGTGQQ